MKTRLLILSFILIISKAYGSDGLDIDIITTRITKAEVYIVYKITNNSEKNYWFHHHSGESMIHMDRNILYVHPVSNYYDGLWVGVGMFNTITVDTVQLARVPLYK
jgi:chitinase